LAAICGSLHAGLTAAEMHHEHLSALHLSFERPSHSAFGLSKGLILEHEKTAAGSFLAFARVLHLALTAADLHHEQPESALHESSLVKEQTSFIFDPRRAYDLRFLPPSLSISSSSSSFCSSSSWNLFSLIYGMSSICEWCGLDG